MGCLYKIDFENGKSYIGITSQTSVSRLYIHKRNARNKRIAALYHAIRKYPDQYTIKEIAWSDNWDVLCEIERQAIITFKTKVPHGYNMTDGGDGSVGHSPSKETRKKMSAAPRKPCSEETKRKIGLSNTGKTKSPEARRKMRLRKLGRKLKPEQIEKIRQASLGSKRTEEQRRHISESRKGKPLSPQHKEALKKAWVTRKLRSCE
jgi:hypothetical protein